MIAQVTLPTDRELVLLAAATYEKDAKPFYQPDGFLERLFRTERADGLVIYMIEGTYNLPGWIGDALAFGAQDHEADGHPTLGFLHADFYRAALRLYPIIASDARVRPVAVGGHSRGAGIAADVSGLLIDDGMPPVKTGLFAPPRAGGIVLVNVVSSHPFCAYRCGNDPVPDFPVRELPDFPYEQFPLTEVGAPCAIPTECHHVTQYVTAIQ